MADPNKYAQFLRDPDQQALDEFNRIEMEGQKRPWYQTGLPMEGRATFLPFKDSMEGSVFNQRDWALPAVIAGAVNAFTSPERARTGTDQTFNPNEEALNFAQNVMGGGIGTSSAMKAPMGQGGKDLAMNAWHGTPHEIKGGFDLSKVGTGEGAQAYGHGMYFGEARGTGEQYAKNLSRAQLLKTGNSEQFDQLIGGKPLVNFYESISKKADRLPIEKAQIEYEKMSFLEDLMSGNNFKDAVKRVDDPEVAKWAQSLEGQYKPAGNLYKVDIPDEQIPMMLNWDKPLNQQSDVVKQALGKLGITVDEKAYKSSLDDLESALLGNTNKEIKDVPNPSGEKIYQNLVAKFGSQEKASEELNKLGITGIRYLDEQSRSKNAGTSNFVVFKPETVKILEKNDVPVDRKELLKEQIDKLSK